MISALRSEPRDLRCLLCRAQQATKMVNSLLIGSEQEKTSCDVGCKAPWCETASGIVERGIYRMNDREKLAFHLGLRDDTTRLGMKFHQAALGDSGFKFATKHHCDVQHLE